MQTMKRAIFHFVRHGLTSSGNQRMNDLLQIADFGKECWTLSIVPAQALVGLFI